MLEKEEFALVEISAAMKATGAILMKYRKPGWLIAAGRVTCIH